MSAQVLQKICTRMFITALPVITPNWKLVFFPMAAAAELLYNQPNMVIFFFASGHPVRHPVRPIGGARESL